MSDKHPCFECGSDKHADCGETRYGTESVTTYDGWEYRRDGLDIIKVRLMTTYGDIKDLKADFDRIRNGATIEDCSECKGWIRSPWDHPCPLHCDGGVIWKAPG